MPEKIKCPCTRHCAERTATCKTTCTRWKEYEAWKFQQYKERDIEREKREKSYPKKSRRGKMQ